MTKLMVVKYIITQALKAGVKKAAKSVNEVSTFEAAYIDENLAVNDQEWIVLGWQTREDITNLISKLCSEN